MRATLSAAVVLGLAAAAAGATVAINAGGGALGGYAADTSPRSLVRSFTADAPGAAASVYSTHAWSPNMTPLVYYVRVPDEGTYNVRLQFAENYDGAGREGARVMNVDVNDERVASGLDVYMRAGGLYKPYNVQKRGVRAVGGRIKVTVSPTRQNALISGIIVTSERAARKPRPPANREPRSPRSPRPVDPSPLPRPSRSPRPARGMPKAARWNMVKTRGGSPVARHEGCAAMAGGKVYVIGGRRQKPVSVYDPATMRWTNKPGPGVEMHHMQCVTVGNQFIYVAGAWTGGFPRERVLDNVYVFDTDTSRWRVEAEGGLGSRARGGGALVLHNNKLYLAMGNRGGHGGHATTLAEFDEYDMSTKRWRRLPNALDARDHVGGGMVNGKLCVAGGRDGGHKDFWKKPVAPVNCYDFGSRTWSRGARMPEGRAGAATGTTCQGYLMVAGGEGFSSSGRGLAFRRVDYYDAASNRFLKPSNLMRGRHGSGLAIADCGCGNIYLPSGSGGLGGGPELKTTEVWSPSGTPRSGC